MITRIRRTGGRRGSRAVGPGSPGRDRALSPSPTGLGAGGRAFDGDSATAPVSSASGSWRCWRATRCPSRPCRPTARWAWVSSWSPSGSGVHGPPCGAPTMAADTITIIDMPTGMRPWRSGRSTDWPAALICWGSCRRSPCPRTAPRAPTCSASAWAASRRWGRSRRFIGWVAGRPRASGAAAQRALLCVCSAIAVLVGGFWLLKSLPVTVPLPAAALEARGGDGH